MSQQVLVKLELPEDLERLQLPRGVDERLQGLLDRQDRGEELTLDERREAEGLVDLAELLPWLSSSSLPDSCWACPGTLLRG